MSALIGPDCPHALDGAGAPLALLYLLPESAEGLRLARAPRVVEDLPEAPARRMRQPLRRCLDQGADLAELDGLAGELVASLRPAGARPALDRRIARVLELLGGHPETPAPLAATAARVGLSPGRLTHLFHEEMGVSLKRYRLWRRLRRAFERMAAAPSMTAVAHEIGFADAAHFSRTFRRMMGVSPSQLARHSTIIGAPRVAA